MIQVTERLVDVLNSNKAVLHTYPITIGAPNVTSNDTAYETKAAEAAAHAQLVPDADLKNLTTRMHVSRGGALAPYGDDRSVLSETKQSLDEVVRERAYLLWEKDGCPHDRSEEYWHLAHDQRLRERAYVLWRQEGCPEGRAEEQWHRSRQCETP
jgi:Protein of unknown function (DUF2934)